MHPLAKVDFLMLIYLFYTEIIEKVVLTLVSKNVVNNFQ
jgi:hypothetical protein